MRKPELLAPAGKLDEVEAAIEKGADALYVGGQHFNLRGKIDNLSLQDIQQAADVAHGSGVKLYVTVNSVPRNHDFGDLEAYLLDLSPLPIDALVIWDPGVIRLVQRLVPHFPIHLSTQANTLNWQSVVFWQDIGVKRVNLARELFLDDIRQIREKTTVELEIFIHGAICISFGGRCVLSNYLAYRDAHSGLCATPCRWRYYLIADGKPGQYFPIIEENGSTYILNSRDLCMIGHIPELVNSGVDSFKIEGRQRGMRYICTVTDVYRQAIDAYFKDPESYTVDPRWVKALEALNARGYTTGFYFGSPGPEDHSYETR